MKKIKRLLAVCLSLCLLTCSSVSTLASAQENDVSSKNDGVKILYQDENVLLYQSKEDSSSISQVVARESNYGNKWINRTSYGQSFNVYCTLTGSRGVTWKVESSSNSSYAQIYMTNPLGLTVLQTKKVKPSDGDVHLQLKNAVTGNYTVHFDGYTTVGMRVMCWIY